MIPDFHSFASRSQSLIWISFIMLSYILCHLHSRVILIASHSSNSFRSWSYIKSRLHSAKIRLFTFLSLSQPANERLSWNPGVVHDWQLAYLCQSISLRAISLPDGLELGRDFCATLGKSPFHAQLLKYTKFQDEMFLAATFLRAKFEVLFFRLSHGGKIIGCGSEVKLDSVHSVYRKCQRLCQSTCLWDRERYV
jgi:hypothetical protein